MTKCSPVLWQGCDLANRCCVVLLVLTTFLGRSHFNAVASRPPLEADAHIEPHRRAVAFTSKSMQQSLVQETSHGHRQSQAAMEKTGAANQRPKEEDEKTEDSKDYHP